MELGGFSEEFDKKKLQLSGNIHHTDLIVQLLSNPLNVPWYLTTFIWI